MRIFIVLPFVFLACLGRAEILDVKTLRAKATEFDKKVVTIRGVVKSAENRISRAGRPYFVTTLIDQKLTVELYGYGDLKKLPVAKDVVQAKGTFYIERTVGRNVFRNEIVIKLDDKENEYRILKPSELVEAGRVGGR
jgi:hypothetical protein